MEPRIDVITLAVSDLERALEFYRELGLESSGVIGTEFTGDDTNPSGSAAMFELAGGLTLALYSRTDLAKDAKVQLGPPKSGEFSIGRMVAAKQDVDAITRQGGGSWRNADGRAARTAVGDLLGLLPRSRRASVGDHLEPTARLAERAIDDDLVQSALESGELLLVEFRDEELQDAAQMNRNGLGEARHAGIGQCDDDAAPVAVGVRSPDKPFIDQPGDAPGHAGP